MKKLTLLTIVLLALSFSFCRKDMTCTCDSTTEGVGPVGSGTIKSSDTKILSNVTKGEGRVNCMSRKYTFSHYTILGDSITDTVITCNLN